VGDIVNYTITLNNNSSPDTPDLECTIKDALLGVDKSVTLASGEGDVTDVAYTVQAGDPDPLVNTASVSCSPQGFPNVLSASDNWTVNLFQPKVTIEKGGDTLSKVGDTVTYTFTISNGSSSDSPDLKLDSISDTVLGDLVAEATAAGCDNLAPGAGCNFTVDRTVLGTDPDPLPNTVTVHYHPVGFTNDITDDDGHEVNLFQPSITFDKTGDALSKVGDEVTYTLTLNNTSSADSPKLNCTITDELLGLDTDVSLVAGGSTTITKPFIIPAGADDPFVNTASVTCSPDGFPNVLTAENGHEINLFQPSIEVSKTGPAYTKAGDTNTYEVTVTNTSSADTPELVDGTLTDTLVGDLLDAANSAVTSTTCDGSLASGESCKVKYQYVTKVGDPDPLVNKAEAHFNPDGFPNDITDSAQHSSDVLHPSFTATKACKAEPISQAGPAIFTITFKNTGDADLHVVPSEGLPFDVAAGQTYSYDYSISGPFSASVSNTVTGTVTLDPKYGLSNSYTFSSTDTCDVKGKVKVVKTVSGQPPAIDQSFTFELRQGASTVADGAVLETKTTDALGNINFSTELNPGQTYQLCEWVFPGWNTNLSGDGPLFVPNSIIPPSLPNPNVNNLTVCVDFSVTSGQTRTFTVDNTPPPGGRALTIGFWKNWASCSSSSGKGQDPMLDLALAYASQVTTNPPGGLVVSAQNPGMGWPNYAATYYLVLKGNPASTEDNILSAPDCAKAVSLLDKRSFDGKKKASDPLFNMAAQLVGAELNRFMGAGINGTTIINIDRAVLLLGKYKFNGTSYTPKLTTADANLANCLAKQLDNYNNNNAVSSCP
jgi:uncharacterized repeat protein (TIGR01451 family)